MDQADRQIARMLPQLRADVERSRLLASRAVDRARRVADETIAMRRRLQARLSGPELAHLHSVAAEVRLLMRDHERQLGTLAHELRQPLAAAMAAHRLCTIAERPEMAAKAHDVLSRQLEHLTDLINNLFEYSRAGSLTAGAELQPLDLCHVVAMAVETIESAALKNKQTVVVHTPSPAVVDGHAARLHQALVNLLQNAIRYTPAGGRIEVGVTVQDGLVVLRVADNGEGIPPERLASIFDPFVRVSGTGAGLGLGLALVRRIADMHGGRISAESDGAGRGSVFTLVLPRAKGTMGS